MKVNTRIGRHFRLATRFRTLKWIGLASGFLPGIALSENRTLQVELFVDSPVTIAQIEGVETTFYDLSAPEQVKADLHPVLPSDPDRAMAMASAFLASPQGKIYQKALAESYKGRALLIKYQVQKVPAIVFDNGRYAVYGTLDIARAVNLYVAAMDSLQSGEGTHSGDSQ